MSEPRIVIYCESESHGSKDRTTIETLERRGGVWRPAIRQVSADANRRAMSGPDWQARALAKLPAPTYERVHGESVVTGALAGDLAGLTDEERARLGHVDGGRGRFHFRCPLCGLDVQRLEERLSPRLDTLAAAGLLEVSLTALGATV